MNIDKLYSLLDSNASSADQRRELVTRLKMCAAKLPDDESDRRLIAYKLAGLLSTHFVKSLDSDDAIDEILTLAGELEIPDDDSEVKWQEFLTLTNNLQ